MKTKTKEILKVFAWLKVKELVILGVILGFATYGLYYLGVLVYYLFGNLFGNNQWRNGLDDLWFTGFFFAVIIALVIIIIWGICSYNWQKAKRIVGLKDLNRRREKK